MMSRCPSVLLSSLQCMFDDLQNFYDVCCFSLEIFSGNYIVPLIDLNKEILGHHFGNQVVTY